PNLPLFFSFFVLVYVTAYFIIFKSWTHKTRPEASSCLISLFHGTPAVVLALHAIQHPNHNSFSSPNTNPQNAALDFSIAYFLTDLLHYLVFYPRDILFIGHHLATLFVFVTCRYLVSHGAFAILVLLVLAEVTSACQNAWTLAGIRRDDVELSRRIHGVLSVPFYALYSVVRGLLGPFFVYQMVRFYMSGEADDVIPRWVWVSWIAVVVLAISVSVLWVLNLWVEFFRERSANKLEKKLR
ncbi:TRAM_LAG1_CLN8 domain-containing protein, partial [Cephalotus follicularis]